MSKILIIEDDESLGLVIKETLLGRLFTVDLVTDGEEGFNWLMNQSFDVAIVDWQLPKMSGLEICQKYRHACGRTPILMLTAKSVIKDRVAGLSAGADDYLCKPFDLEELVARVRALLRRSPDIKPTELSYGDITLNPESGTVSVVGQRIHLTKMEFAVLELLVRNPGVALSSDYFIHRAWPTDSDTSQDSVRVHITRLRTKLSTALPGTGDLIKSIYGVGYKIE